MGPGQWIGAFVFGALALLALRGTHRAATQDRDVNMSSDWVAEVIRNRREN